MPDADLEKLKTALAERWSRAGGEKVQRYVDQFFDRTRRGARIMADVVGNHGTYTVSLQIEGPQQIESACSCYIGKRGNCHHCAALAVTFLNAPDSFTVVQTRSLEDVETLDDLNDYLNGVTLDELISRLQANGITQKAFAQSLGMNPRHLSAVKSSERRNRHFHELGALKVACLWALEHFTDEV